MLDIGMLIHEIGLRKRKLGLLTIDMLASLLTVDKLRVPVNKIWLL